MSYNVHNIEVLEGVQAIRKRPGMYIQGMDSLGLHQLFKELLDNSVDEYLSGHCTFIEITLSDSKDLISIVDNGRGIPVEIHPKTNISTLTTVFTVPHSGGKFNKESYEFSAGLHGVGITATNALSQYLYVQTKRPNGIWEQDFVRGEPLGPLIEPKDLKVPRETGTFIMFQADPFLFPSIKFSVETIRSFLVTTSYLCPGLKLVLKVANEEPQEFQVSEGISQLLKDNIAKEGLKELYSPYVVFAKDVELALTWTNGSGETWFCYTNITPTPEGGPQVTGARRALTKAIQEFTTEPVVPKDLREGLRAVFSIRVNEPQFKGQTKDKLLNPEWDLLAYQTLLDPFINWFSDHPDIVPEVAQKAAKLRKAREAFNQRKKALHEAKGRQKAKGLLPGKLAEAPFCKVEERELFVCEGDSASGSAKKARDPRYQEVLPLRGKVLNAARTTPGKLLQNSELRALLQATGTLVVQEETTGTYVDNVDNVRVGKLILLMDPDPDGKHITSLLLTFLALWCPKLIQKGLVFIVDSPLYVAVQKDQRWFAHSLKELKGTVPVNLEKCLVSRLKGWGEASPEELWECALNPKTRKLFKVHLEPGDQEGLLNLMGANSGTRKKILGIQGDSNEDN